MDGHESSDAALRSALRAVAEDDERLGTSNAVGMRLLAEVQSLANARRRRATIWSLAAAAAVFVSILVPVWPRLAMRPASQSTSADMPVVTRELVTEFFPLAYSNVPARGGYVVRMQVPRGALERFGADSFAPRGSNSSTVLADVVIGDDGLARAVRFVRVVNDQQEQTP